MKKILALVSLGLLQACGTVSDTEVYTPYWWEPPAGGIFVIQLKGDVTATNGQPLNNAQPPQDKATVSSDDYIPPKWVSNLNDVTQAMVVQTNIEIKKNAKVVGTGTSKTIELKVDSLVSKHRFLYFNSIMKFSAKLGSGVVVQKTVIHDPGDLSSRGYGSDMDACLAEAVMNLLNDQQVRDYLAQ